MVQMLQVICLNTLLHLSFKAFHWAGLAVKKKIAAHIYSSLVRASRPQMTY